MTLFGEIWNSKANVFISEDSKVARYISGVLNSKLIDFYLYNLIWEKVRGVKQGLLPSKKECEKESNYGR
jgi:hypothetical protein